jgi:peptidoglycan glycosyltransferase
VNGPIVRVFAVTLVLFGLLVAFTSRWTLVERDSLQDNPKNRRALIEQQKIARGAILAADGSVLARSRRRADGLYTRTYPQAGLFAQTVGYSFLTPGNSGLERQYNGELTGRGEGLQQTLRRLQGRDRRGNDLRTALDPAAQQTALDGLAGRAGSVVALDPRTGRVKVMASNPSYDPNALRDPRTTARLNSAPGAPLLNRATQAGYPPGSTFKVVTAVAALDSGRFTTTSTLSGANGVRISGVPLNNAGGEDFGDVDMATALTNSVNTYWAQVGEKLGGRTMQRYMDRFGFVPEELAVDLPADQRRPSGEFCNGRFVRATNPCVDVGRMAIGQDKLQVTPLQMAMVASAVANRGTLMRPFIATRAIDPDGRTSLQNEPRELAQVMRRRTAAEVTAMMTRVVQEGTGTAAALAGIDVAGKTGTAERNVEQNITQPWFIGFAPAGRPRVAIAVTVERTVGGFGGTDAAPIAAAVMESLLR